MRCLVIFLGILSLGRGGIPSRQTVSRIYVLKGYCDEYGHLPSGLQNISLKMDSNRRSLINATFVIEGDLTENIFMETNMIKCKDKDSPDSCTNFKSMKFPNACLLLTAKNQVWSPAVNTVPPLTCPIKKGRYVLTNGYYDLSKSPFPLEPLSFWKIKFKLTTSKTLKTVMCYYAECLIVPMKKT